MSNPSPTDPVAVREWAYSLGFTRHTRILSGERGWTQRGPSGPFLEESAMAFFYNVVQQQRVAAQVETCDKLWVQVRPGTAAWEFIGNARIEYQQELAALNQQSKGIESESVKTEGDTK